MPLLKKQALLFFALLLCASAYPQGVRYDVPPILNSRAVLVPNANISLCPGTATITNSTCSPASTQAFTDITLTTPCATGSPVVLSQTNVCSGVADALGNAGFWLAPGAYIYCINGPTITGKCYNLTVPLGTTAGGTATVSTIAPCAQAGVQYVDAANTCGRAGSDPGAWINAAAAALPAAGGIVDACGLNVVSPPTITTYIAIPPRVTLRVCGNLTSSNTSGFASLGCGGSSIIGQGPGPSAALTTPPRLLCTGLSAGLGCITLLGNTTSCRGYGVKNLRIDTTGAGNSINLNDGIGQIEIDQVQMLPAGNCIRLVPGAQGGFFLHIVSSRCDNPTNFGFELDASANTAWTTIKIENSYVNNVSGSGIGINMGNVNSSNIIASSVDNSVHGFQLGGQVSIWGGDSEVNSTDAISIAGAGDYVIDNLKGFNNASLITVNAANANTTIINPRSSGTTGANDIAYVAGSTGDHMLIGGSGLSKAVSVGAGVGVIQCIQAKCTLLNGTTAQKAETGADAALLSYTPPSTTGTYQVCISMAVSAQNTATLGWTATWTDSNGSTQAPTNLALNQTGVAAPALTFTAATNGIYYGCHNVDVNNSGTAIVVKTTFSGTSIAYKASAGIVRLQ